MTIHFFFVMFIVGHILANPLGVNDVLAVYYWNRCFLWILQNQDLQCFFSGKFGRFWAGFRLRVDSGEGPGRGRAPTRFPGKVFGRIPGVLREGCGRFWWWREGCDKVAIIEKDCPINFVSILFWWGYHLNGTGSCPECKGENQLKHIYVTLEHRGIGKTMG